MLFNRGRYTCRTFAFSAVEWKHCFTKCKVNIIFMFAWR